MVDGKAPRKVALAYTAADGPAPRLVPSQRSRSPDFSPLAADAPAPDAVAHVASADAEAAAVRLLQLALAHGCGAARSTSPAGRRAFGAQDLVQMDASLRAWPCGPSGSSPGAVGGQGLRSFRVPIAAGAAEETGARDDGHEQAASVPSPRDVHWCVVTGQPRAPAVLRGGASAMATLLPWPSPVVQLLDTQGLLVVMQDKLEERGCGPVPQLMLSCAAMPPAALELPLTGALASQP